MSDITRLLNEIKDGDPTAADRLAPLVYVELLQLAKKRMRNEGSDHTLTPTGLVHEAYVRLVDGPNHVQWNGRGHFFAAAADAMRRILIDHARQKNSAKRGGQWSRIDFAENEFWCESRAEDLIELDEALDRLERTDQETARLIKLRFFAGFTNAAAAEYLNISPRKADQLWAYGKAWLRREMAFS